MTSWWRRRPLHLTDEDLSGYLDNETSAREAERIRAHLDSCEDCRARFEGLRAVQSMLSALPRAVAPRSFVLSPEQAGVQTPSRAPAYVAPPAPRFRIPSFAPAVALTFFLAVLAVDLAGSSVSQQEDSTAGGAAMSAPVRSSYNADDAGKQGGTTLVAPQANVPPVAESAAGSPSTGPIAPVPSTTNSAAGAAPETTRAASIPPPTTGSSFGGATQSATAMPSTAQSSVPPVSSAPADTFSSSADLSNANTDAASQIGVEPAQGGDADGGQSGARDGSGGLDGITVLEIALFVLFLGSLAAVVWPRLFSKGVR